MGTTTQIHDDSRISFGEIHQRTQRTPAELAEIVEKYASSELWLDRVRLRSDRRWYERIHLGANYDVWLISWMPGQSTGFHDHGGSSGAFIVATGTLIEHRPVDQIRVLAARDSRAFGPDYAHDVRNISAAPAITIHAYSPPLTEMNEYDLEGDALIPRSDSQSAAECENRFASKDHAEAPSTSTATSVDEMLASARDRIQRLSPLEAFKAVSTNEALIVDIRPESQRAREGSIPGALIIERNVLEWRFDPTSASRLPVVRNHDVQIIVFCSEGYTSSLAAAALQELGLWRATDIIGGFKGWMACRLPTSES